MQVVERFARKRGVVLIEATFTIPLLLLVFFGVLVASLGFTSYALTSLDVVTAYVAKDTFEYRGTLSSEDIVHGHSSGASLNLPPNDERALIFANLASGRANRRNEPFGTPNAQTVTYAYSSASKVGLSGNAGGLQEYSVRRTFMPWFRGFESMSVSSTVVSSN